MPPGRASFPLRGFERAPAGLMWRARVQGATAMSAKQGDRPRTAMGRPGPPLVASLIVLALTGVAVAGAIVMIRPSDSVLPASSPPPPLSESAACARIDSNASLDSVYASIYSGLPPIGQGGLTGPNQSALAGQNAYPNLTAGESQLVAAWTAICDSPSFTSLDARWGAGALGTGYQLLASGFYEASFQFIYHASCSNSSDNSSSGCEWITTWNVNLSSGGVSGPVTTGAGTPFGWGPPQFEGLAGNGSRSPAASPG
jgi:hypothetical protein